MKEKIFEILQAVQNGEQSIGDAQSQLLLLFNVSVSLPTMEEISKEFEHKIKIGNNIRKLAGLPYDTPAKYSLKMLWFMDGCQFIYDKVKNNYH